MREDNSVESAVKVEVNCWMGREVEELANTLHREAMHCGTVGRQKQ